MEVLNKDIHQKQIRPIKIIQMGEGNFLRGFCDTFINRLNKNTDFNGDICIVQPRDSHKIQKFWDQDLLYTSITEGIENGSVVSESEIVDSIGDAIDPYDNYEAFLKYAESSDVKVFVSNTTESGIYFEEEDVNLSITPKSYPAKLLAFLKRRYEHFGDNEEAGIYIVPCELISNNGDTLKKVLIKLARLNNLDEKFINWMISFNKFYNTLVDRIIPGYPKDDAVKWFDAWGYVDNLAVKGEAYHLWCLQGDNSLFEVLPLDKISNNIILCDDITPYKERKVKILNGSHTFLVSIAYQLGFRIVNKTVSDEGIKKLLDVFINKEVLPSINLPSDEILKFKNDVIDRFANPTIQHEWTSIMLNSMSKYKERVLPVLKHYCSNNADVPRLALFSLASLFCLYKLNVKEKIFNDSPEFLDMWNMLCSGDYSDEDVVEYVLNLDFWDYDFNKDAIAYVQKKYIAICSNGLKYEYELLLNEVLDEPVN